MSVAVMARLYPAVILRRPRATRPSKDGRLRMTGRPRTTAGHFLHPASAAVALRGSPALDAWAAQVASAHKAVYLGPKEARHEGRRQASAHDLARGGRPHGRHHRPDPAAA